MNKEYTITSEKTIFNTRNITVAWNGWMFDVVYWQRDNDWFVAIPNHNVSCIMSNPADTIYNVGRINKEMFDETKAMVIAMAIKEDWERREDIESND